MFIHSKNSIIFVQAALESSIRRSAFTPACRGIEKKRDAQDSQIGRRLSTFTSGK